MKTLGKTSEMNRNELYALGATDAGPVCGVHPYRSAVDVFLDVLNMREPFEGNERTYFGQKLEPFVHEEFCRQYISENPGAVIELDQNEYVHQSDKHDWQTCTEDYVGTIDGKLVAVECKTANERQLKRYEDGVPDEYMAQCAHQMAVNTELDYVILAVFFFAPTFKFFKVPRDEALIAEITSAEKAFWENHIETKAPPPLTGAGSASIAALYPEAKGEQILLPPDAENIIQEVDYWKDAEKEAKSNKDAASAKLKAMIKDAPLGICGDRKVRWSNVKSSRFDSKTFQQENPEVYNNYIKTTTHRRFSIS